MKDFIINLAREAGKKALEYNYLDISSKGEKNIVTQADKEINDFIVESIRKRFPEHNIVSEESDNKCKGSDFTWYIDPIDGTNNFVHNDPNYCVSIALAEKNEIKYGCVYIPVHDELFFAEKGKGAFLNGKKISVSKTEKLSNALIQVGISPLKKYIDKSLAIFKHFTLNADRARDYGFCAGQLAYLASGRADGFVKDGQNSWDIAAGVLLVEEAGGKITDFEGNKILLNSQNQHHKIIASNGILHDNLLSEMKKIIEKIDNGG